MAKSSPESLPCRRLIQHMMGCEMPRYALVRPVSLGSGEAVLGVQYDTPVHVAKSNSKKAVNATELIKACGEGCVDRVRKLLEAGAAVNGVGLEASPTGTTESSALTME